MRSIIVVSFVLASVGLIHAEDAYTLKFKLFPDIGKTTTFRSSDISSGSMQYFDADGKLLGERKREGDETVYRATVLERDKDGMATRFIRVYEKATEKEDGKTKTFSYQGRTLLFEKVDGKFRIGVVGEPPLHGDDVEKLYKDVNDKGSFEAMLRNLPPGKLVKVGDSWSIPVKPIAESFDEMPISLEKSSVRAKLVKVYANGKSQFATFEIAIKFVLSGTLEKDGTVMTFDKAGEITGTSTLDAAIDGSSVERKESNTLAIKGEASVTRVGQKFRMVFDIRGTGGDEKSAEMDDPKAWVVPKATFVPAQGEWIEFKSKDGFFRAMFPGSPKQETKEHKDGDRTTQWTAVGNSKTVGYFVSITDFAKNDAARITPKSLLDVIVKNTNKAKNLREIDQNGYPGVEYTWEMTTGKTDFEYRQRSVVANGRLVHLFVMTEKGKQETGDSAKFFRSFEILQKPKPAEWVEFKPKDGAFQIQFPVKPTENTVKGEAFTEAQFFAHLDGGRVSYGVAVTEFAGTPKIDAKAIVTKIATSLNPKSQKEIEVNGYPGIEILYERDSSGTKKIIARQIIYVNGRVFEISVAFAAGAEADADKFFKSLKLLEKPQKKDD
jgi:hypothetical protein